MMREKFLALAIAVGTFGVVTGGIVGVGLVTAEPAGAQSVISQNLSGDWTGGYISSDHSDVNTFNVKLRQQAQALAGTVNEPNVFGDQSQALFLTSTVTGDVRGDAVQFVKTYDGSAGVSHSVRYQGKLDHTGRRIRGTYTLEGGSGTFEMVR